MDERRRIARKRTLKSARMVFNHSGSVIDCTVRNLTEIGACLHVPDSLGVPDKFDLMLASSHERRPCHVVWRTDTKLGISFDEPVAAAG
jgi:PilZ domain